MKISEKKNEVRICCNVLLNKTIEANPAIIAPVVTLIKVLSRQTSHLFDNFNSDGNNFDILFSTFNFFF